MGLVQSSKQESGAYFHSWESNDKHLAAVSILKRHSKRFLSTFLFPALVSKKYSFYATGSFFG